MKISSMPENEQERLEAIESYHILDTENEQDFDDIIELASQVCDTPIALITLIDQNRQWFKSKTGLDIKETHRNLSFCAHAIHMNDVMIVSDTSQDERFFDNPLVTSEPYIRFYAGMPLITGKGYKLGTLAVIDRKPRELSDQQLKALRILGKQVVNLLDLRIRNLELKNLVLEKTTGIKDAFERNVLIMDSSLDAIIIIDHAAAITFWNPQAEKIFGWNKAEMIGREMAETIIPQQHRQQHLKGMAHYLKTGEGLLLNKLIEITALNREGKEFPIELTIAPIKEGNNEFFCAFIRDISERKKQEAFLLESKENLERAEQQANLGSWHFEVDSGKRYWSKQMFRIFGLDPLNEVPSFEDNLERYHPDDRGLIKVNFEKMQHGEEPEAIVLRTNPALLPLRYLLSSCGIVKEAGKPIKFEGTLLDVTQQKISADKLAESENRLHTIIQTEPECIKLTGANCELLEMNPAGLAMIEAENLEQVIGHSVLGLVAPKYREEFIRLTKDVFDGKSRTMEYEMISLKATNRWIETHAVPLRNTEGKIISVLAVARDITERKHNEESLREAEVRYRSIFENALDGIYQSTPDGKFITANQSMAGIFGYRSPEELITSITDIGTQLYADSEVRIHMKELLMKDGRAVGYELRAIKKDKEIIWIRANIRAVYDKGQRIKYFEGSLKDITEQKNQEEAIIKEKNLAVSFVNSLPGVFYMYDHLGKFLRWNRKFETITGYSAEEIAIMHPLEFFAEGQERDLVVEKISEVFAKGFASVESNFLLKDKTKIPYYFNDSKIFYENKPYLIGVGIDISDRKKSEEKLYNSENKLRAFFRSTPDAIVLLGRNFEILAFNHTANELAENTYGKGLYEGDIYTDLIFPEVSLVISGFLSKALHGETSHGEFPIPNINTGKSIWWHSVFMPAYDKEGNIFGVIANSTNINELKWAEIKLRKQFEELLKTNNELDHFVYSVSHDLRSPISSILGLINIAELEEITPTLKKYLEMIRGSVNRLDNFIKNILDYSFNARIKVQVSQINFQKLIDTAQNNFNHVNGAERLKINVSLAEKVPFYSDTMRIEILLNNLISNSIKYQDYKKESACLNIQIETSTEKAAIKFFDNGIGIESKYLDKLFGMFYRASENSKGAGIGLYIAKETLNKLGGTIKVESEFGLSATFEITIPNSIPS